MADIAMAFHFSMVELDRLSLDELMEWRERARIRYEVKNGTRP